MSNEETIFVGNGRERVFPDGGSLINLSICVDDLMSAESNFTKHKSGKRYIRLIACRKKTEDDYGNTHFIKVDTWMPSEKKEGAHKPNRSTTNYKPKPTPQSEIDEDDVPF